MDYSGPVSILRPNNGDIICIIEFVNGVSVSKWDFGDPTVVPAMISQTTKSYTLFTISKMRIIAALFSRKNLFTTVPGAKCCYYAHFSSILGRALYL